MDYINAPGAVVDAQGRRQFANQIPGQQAGTDLDETVFNPTVNEVVNCIKQSGQDPSAGDETQLWQAILKSPGNWLNIEVITSSRMYVVPAGVYRIRVAVQAAGGAGGGSVDNVNGTGSSSGSSGSAGASAIAVFAVTPGQKIPCTVGAGGVGKTAQDGNSGGASVFGPVGSLEAINCEGGPGGFVGGQAPANGAYLTPAPQQVPLPTGANIVFSRSGSAGHPGNAMLGAAAAAPGGDSQIGSGGAGQVSYATTNAVPGSDAKGWGGGGGAHANQQGPQNAGGAGGDGAIFIEEYSA